MVNDQRGHRAGTANPSQGASNVAAGAAQVKEQVQEKAGQLREQVAEGATSRLEGGKEAATGGLNTVAHAIRQTGGQLREHDQGAVAQYVDRAAEQLEDFAGYLSKRDVRELVRDAEGFARREPALFLGGAFTLGLLAARFLKSSGAAAQSSQGNWRGQADWYGSTPALPTTAPPRAPAGYPIPSPTVGTRAVPPAPAAMPAPAVDTGGTLGTSLAVGGRPAGTASGMSDADVIVGGPPIDDAIVGGPPIDRGRGRQ